MGSGNIIHNLRMADLKNVSRKDYGIDWAKEAQQLVNRSFSAGDYLLLLEYHQQGRAMHLAVLAPDHYLPLLYILGLKHDPANHQFFNGELVAGSLSMTFLMVS